MADFECHKRPATQNTGIQSFNWRQWIYIPTISGIRQGALVLWRGATRRIQRQLTYSRTQVFYRVRVQAVVSRDSLYILASTACEPRFSRIAGPNALRSGNTHPVLTANVTLRSAAPSGLGTDGYYWGSQYWADFVVADWVWARSQHRQPSNRATFDGVIQLGGDTQPKIVSNWLDYKTF